MHVVAVEVHRVGERTVIVEDEAVGSGRSRVDHVPGRRECQVALVGLEEHWLAEVRAERRVVHRPEPDPRRVLTGREVQNVCLVWVPNGDGVCRDGLLQGVIVAADAGCV